MPVPVPESNEHDYEYSYEYRRHELSTSGTQSARSSFGFMKKYSPTTAFILGLWLGGSIFLLVVVTYTFVGIKPSFEANEALAARAGFDPDDEPARKTSVLPGWARFCGNSVWMSSPN